MNWAGLVFGVALVLAVGGAAGAAFVQQARTAVLLLAVSMAGVAGILLALGNDYLALITVTLLGAAVPAAMIAALLLAPVADPDTRPGRWRAPAVALAISAGFGLLSWLLTSAPWVPAGGQRQESVEWIGSRLLTDQLLVLVLCAALLGLSGVGAVALLRGRRAGR